jgi:hypothetical protein
MRTSQFLLAAVAAVPQLALAYPEPEPMPMAMPAPFAFAFASPQSSGCYGSDVVCGLYCIPAADTCCSDGGGGCPPGEVCSDKKPYPFNFFNAA